MNPNGSPPSVVNMPMLVLARACTIAVFMTYPACLAWLMDAWQMAATRAGLVQGAFTASFAASLLVVSFLCDRFGARRVFAWAAISCAASALIFAAFARSSLEAPGPSSHARIHRPYLGAVWSMGMDPRFPDSVVAVARSHDRHRGWRLDGGHAPRLGASSPPSCRATPPIALAPSRFW